MKLQLGKGKQIFAIVFCITVFISCEKDTVTQPPALIDTIKGREFLFENLSWETVYDDIYDVYLTYITTPERQDLFSFRQPKEVSFKLNSSSVWIYAQANFSTNDFWYTTNYPKDRLRIITSNPNFNLTGQQASVRVKY